jgi:hypothetical protein
MTTLSPEKKLATEALDGSQKKRRMNIGVVWYIVLFMYMVLVGSTSYITFFYNNGYAAQDEHIKKMEMCETPDQLKFFTELLEIEIKSMNNINALASQSFNVVLGALLGFLSASATMMSGKKKEKIKAVS